MTLVACKKTLDPLFVKILVSDLLLIAFLTLAFDLFPCRLYGFGKLVLVNGFKNEILHSKGNGSLGIAEIRISRQDNDLALKAQSLCGFGHFNACLSRHFDIRDNDIGTGDHYL